MIQELSYREAQDLEMGPKKANCKIIDLAIYPLIVFLSVLLFIFFIFSFGFYGYRAHPLNLIFDVFLVPLLK
jgi:hypothetical protein